MNRIEYALLLKPMPGESISGDIAWVKEFNSHLLVCLIDASEHGSQAHQVASTCVNILEKIYKKNLDQIITSLNDYLIGKPRGIVIGLLSIEINTGFISYLGVGNIRTRIIGKQNYRFVSRPGVLGFTKTRLILERYLLNNNDILLMYSDGITDRFEIKDIEALQLLPITDIPVKIIQQFSKNIDDSSCIAVRYRYE